MIKNKGIVLKSFLPYKQKILLLDRALGKIEGVPDSLAMTQRLCRGAMINYCISEQRNSLFLREIDIINVPFEWARKDILFLHHMLELCYYFLTFDVVQQDIYDLLESLYGLAELPGDTILKKIVLVRFFLGVGLYPEESKGVGKEWLHAVATIPIDDILRRGMHLPIIESDIDAWLLLCMNLHHHVALFKTIHFLQTEQ